VDKARNLLLVLLAFTFSGAVPLLRYFSPLLLPVYAAVMLACIAICVLADHSLIDRSVNLWPYALWLIFFFAWGTLVSLDREAVLPIELATIGKDFLVLGALAGAVIDRKHLSRLAGLIQIAVIIALGFSIWEYLNPQVLLTLAYTADPNGTAFSELRPAGLWVNPNEAAFLFLLGLILSGLARPPLLAWAGRLAGLVGLYLTASRSGFYILLLCMLIYIVYLVKPWRISPAVVPALVAVAALLGALVLILASRPGGLGVYVPPDSTLGRVLDVTESQTADLGIATRGDVTLQALQAASQAPWFGDGVFTFQGTDILTLGSPLPLGAHDIYLVVWGETGILSLLIYLVVLGIGIRGMFRSALSQRERVLLGLLWLSYLIIGVVWHNQFTSLLAILFAGLLFQIPAISHQPSAVSHQKQAAGSARGVLEKLTADG
jgi:hypothetical protein